MVFLKYGRRINLNIYVRTILDFFFIGPSFLRHKKTRTKKRERARERERERERKKSVGVALRACWIYTIKKCALGEIKSQYSSCVVVSGGGGGGGDVIIKGVRTRCVTFLINVRGEFLDTITNNDEHDVLPPRTPPKPPPPRRVDDDHHHRHFHADECIEA